MICKKCGKVYKDDSRFCPYCGTPNPEVNKSHPNPINNIPPGGTRIVRPLDGRGIGPSGKGGELNGIPARPPFEQKERIPCNSREDTVYTPPKTEPVTTSSNYHKIGGFILV